MSVLVKGWFDTIQTRLKSGLSPEVVHEIKYDPDLAEFSFVCSRFHEDKLRHILALLIRELTTDESLSMDAYQLDAVPDEVSDYGEFLCYRLKGTGVATGGAEGDYESDGASFTSEKHGTRHYLGDTTAEKCLKTDTWRPSLTSRFFPVQAHIEAGLRRLALQTGCKIQLKDDHVIIGASDSQEIDQAMTKFDDYESQGVRALNLIATVHLLELSSTTSGTLLHFMPFRDLQVDLQQTLVPDPSQFLDELPDYCTIRLAQSKVNAESGLSATKEREANAGQPYSGIFQVWRGYVYEGCGKGETCFTTESLFKPGDANPLAEKFLDPSVSKLSVPEWNEKTIPLQVLAGEALAEYAPKPAAIASSDNPAPRSKPMSGLDFLNSALLRAPLEDGIIASNDVHGKRSMNREPSELHLKDMSTARLAENEEVDSRVFGQAYRLKSPADESFASVDFSQTDSEASLDSIQPTNEANLFRAERKLLDLLSRLTLYNGQTDMRLEFGRIMFAGVPDRLGKSFWEREQWPEVIARFEAHDIDCPTWFTNRITRCSTDAEHILGLNMPSGDPMFHGPTPHSRKCIYEFHCSKVDQEFVIRVRVHKGSVNYEIWSVPEEKGQICWSYPERTWDGCLSITGTRVLHEYERDVDQLTSSICIPAGKPTLEMTFTVPPELHVERVLEIRQTFHHCQCSSVDLEVSHVTDLPLLEDPQNIGRRLLSNTNTERIAFEQRSWFAFALVPAAGAMGLFIAHTDITSGYRAHYRPAHFQETSLLKKMVGIMDQVIRQIDNVGRHNARSARKALEREELPILPRNVRKAFTEAKLSGSSIVAGGQGLTVTKAFGDRHKNLRLGTSQLLSNNAPEDFW